MEEVERLAMGDRISDLRERSPFTQPDIAAKLGIGLRAYQKLEAKGTTKWERVEEIAKIHDANPNWLWDGRERSETPDPFADPRVEQLDHIETMLEEVLERLPDDADSDFSDAEGAPGQEIEASDEPDRKQPPSEQENV